MEKVAIDQLSFLDLQGNVTSLTGYFDQRLLLVFHRHLA
jgi:hypothetical protein